MFDTKKKVLIIDDMLTIRKIVRKTLKEIEFSNFEEACNGAEAWKFLQVSPDFEFIISDWNMPEMTGVELLKLVRQTPETRHIPFIFLTAESDMGQVKQALELGADNYILKPFTPKDLKDKLEITYTKVKTRLPGSAA